MWGADGRSWRRHAPTETSTAHCHRQGRAPWPLRSRQCLQAEPPETQPARSPAAPQHRLRQRQRTRNPRLQPEAARGSPILSDIEREHVPPSVASHALALHPPPC